MQKEFKFVKHASATRRNRTTPRQTGFSLVELLVVVAVAMIIGGMCAPLLMNTVNQYQLRAASVDLDNLLQQARMKAVRDNKFYTVKTNTSNTQIFFDLNGNGSWDAGEPVVVLPRGASALPGASGGWAGWPRRWARGAPGRRGGRRGRRPAGCARWRPP